MPARYLKHSLLAAILSSAIAIAYFYFYQAAFIVNFNRVINPLVIITGCTLVCIFVSFIRYNAINWWGEKATHWLNLALTFLTLASIFIPFIIKLPLDVQNPELFPGLVVPVQLFPVLIYYTTLPFFK